MSKLSLEYLICYPKKEVYLLAYQLGRRLVDYLGEELFCELLESKLLMNYSQNIPELLHLSDHSYKLHPGAKGLEGFLNKLIKGKSLKNSSSDNIGDVFGKQDQIVRKKIKNKKLISKTKSVWDFCRNDIMHYTPNQKSGTFDTRKKYDEIIEIIVLLYKDFYGKSDPDEEINEGFDSYIRNGSQLKSKKSSGLMSFLQKFKHG